MSKFPNQSPYNFVYNDVIRKKDIDGKYGSDGHYWTAYAMGIALGLPNETAIEYALHAENYDNVVTNFSSIQDTQFEDRYTWAIPFLQERMHGLNGGSSFDVNWDATGQILSGNLDAFHLLGDSYAHARKSSNYETMYRGFLELGLGHVPIWEDADNISEHKGQYKKYLNDLSKMIAYVSGVDADYESKVFDVVSNCDSRFVRTNILKSYIAKSVGQELTINTSSVNDILEIERGLDKLGINYNSSVSLDGDDNFTHTTTIISDDEKNKKK